MVSGDRRLSSEYNRAVNYGVRDIVRDANEDDISNVGCWQTCRRPVTMSVLRGRAEVVGKTQMTPERTLGPPDQQVTINLCRNCIARRAGWNMFPEGPGDVVMHTV